MSSQTSSTLSDGPRSFVSAVLPVMVVVLIGFMIIGLALPVLPRQVHDTLEFRTFVVGLVTSAQFATSLASRFWSGDFADRRGGKEAIIWGLSAASVGGVFYLVSLLFSDAPSIAVTALLAGRAILGFAESLMITGAMSPGLVRSGSRQTGQVIA